MSLSIAGAVVASPDERATTAAWERLGVTLPVDVVPVDEGVDAGLVEVVLATPDVAAAATLLGRRGLDVDGDLVTIACVRWRLAEATTPDAAGPPPSGTLRRASAHSLRLDHVVVSATDATRAAADYGARLGLDLRLDRDTGFGFRGVFFRCGDAVVEVVVPDAGEGPDDRRDAFAGIAWRSNDLEAERARLADAGVDVSEVRRGRKPGTVVATVRDPDLYVPTLLVGPA